MAMAAMLIATSINGRLLGRERPVGFRRGTATKA
jgi:hypothetical protein